MAGFLHDEVQVDIRDDMSKWMELVNTTNLPLTTLEAIKHGFGIETIGTMQASLRSEADLDDFLHASLFQENSPLLSITGTDGWERELRQDRFRISKWGAAMTRPREDCHHAARISRQAPAMGAGQTCNPTSFRQAIGQAIEANPTARGEEPPAPRMDNKKRRELLVELQQTWPGLLLREVIIPGPRNMDQLWNDRKPGKGLKYHPWKAVTSFQIDKEFKKKSNSRTMSESAWQARMMDPDLPQRDNIPNSQHQVQLPREIRRICHCLTGWARHDSHLEYDTKSLDHSTASYDPALKERSPNLAGFLPADEHIWNPSGGTVQLVNNGTWTWSEVLHDVAHNRMDIELFMGLQNISESSSKGWKGTRKHKKGGKGAGVRKKDKWEYTSGRSRKGKGDRGCKKGGRVGNKANRGGKADRGGGRGSKGNGRNPVNWPRNWATSVKAKQVCHKFHQTGSCQHGDNCRLDHKHCVVMKSNGNPCGSIGHTSKNCDLPSDQRASRWLGSQETDTEEYSSDDEIVPVCFQAERSLIPRLPHEPNFTKLVNQPHQQWRKRRKWKRHPIKWSQRS